MKVRHKLTKNYRQKVVIENFCGLEVIEILWGLKQKICIFIKTKNIINPIFKHS